MRKIENWLLLPVLFLLCWSFFGTSTLDIHLHDTYYVIDGVSILRFQAYALLIIFGMYKTVRHRHENINPVFALLHIFLTILLTGLMLIPSATATGRAYLDYSNWSSYQSFQWNAIAIIVYSLIQVIFLGYFVVQIFKRPAN